MYNFLKPGWPATTFPEELITMRETANRQREDTVWGTFHIWLQEDAN
jgi:hypothetical protein